MTSFNGGDRWLHPHVYAGALALLTSWSALSQTCSEANISPQLGTEISRWKELSRSGKRLVLETGHLHSKGLTFSVRCNLADGSFAWSDSRGTRTYLGATNTGQAATSSSDIAHQKISGSVYFHADENWSVGGRWVHNAIHRSIQSTNQAEGYPEHFQFNEVSLGVRYKHALSAYLIGQIDYWQGRILPGQSNVTFPNFAPTRLQLGSGRSREMGISIGNKLGANDPAWTWSAAIHIRQDRIAEGSPQALYKGSRLVASAVQPEIGLRTSQFIAKLNYAF